MTQKTMESARCIQKQLHQQQEQKAKRLKEILETFLPRVEKVIDQTVRRVLQGEQVPAQEKIVSLFEEHTDIIRRGKEARPVDASARTQVLVERGRRRTGEPLPYPGRQPER